MTIHYQLDGRADAPVIVLSNSLGTTLSMWDGQMEALLAHFRVLRYDTHGHGCTTKQGKVTLAQLGEDVLSVMTQAGVEKAHFCGISMGGITGLWLARFAPERFYSVTVANSAAKIGEQANWLSRARTVRQEGMGVVAAGSADRWFTPSFRQHHPAEVESLVHQLATSKAEGYAECCEALAAADLRAEVADIRLPLLLIAGEADPVTTVPDSEFLRNQVPEANLVRLPASHLSNIEQPALFNAALLGFLQKG
ncbi:3-oxoadipate enol-lactonase [Enterobacteriaceae bacterium 4M9]|nr:3-oxoadipate enol-lactonase [Enterobacteriaceae bacterium 4M9]